MGLCDILFRIVITTLCVIYVTCDTVLDLHPIMNFDPVDSHFHHYFKKGFHESPLPIISPMAGATGGGPLLHPPMGTGKFFNFPQLPIGFVGLPAVSQKHYLAQLAGAGGNRPRGGPPYTPVNIPIGQDPNSMSVLHFPRRSGPGKAALAEQEKLMNTQAVGMVVQGPSLAENKYKGPTVDSQHHLPMNHLFVPIPVMSGGGGEIISEQPMQVYADILIVIDASEQMGHIGPLGEVVWNPGVSQFVNQLIDNTPMGPDLNRIGVVVVSVGIDDMIPITPDKPFLLNALTQLRPTFRGGCTEKGISTASSLFYQYGRPNAVKRIVLLGEGSPQCPYRNMAEIMYARKCGIDIVTVGFGPMLAPGMKGKYRSSWIVPGPKNLVDVARPVAERAYITPVHGGWSTWSAWNPCSSSGTCDIGYQMRFRLCDNPMANYGGRTCDGYPAETRMCHMTPCIDKTFGHWSPWSEFTACSSPCGIGSRTRFRRCITLDGRPSAMCQGKYVEMAECIVKQCPVNGNWSPWSQYGVCSANCGVGVKMKVRQCDNPPPKHGGKPCTGPAVEEMVCDTGVPCPVNGGFGTWSTWGHCDATCGIGKQTSERVCDSPLPQFGGMPCEGDTLSFRPCDTGIPCPVHGNWGHWSTFGTCSVACGIGIRVRERFCDNPPPSFGGAVCQGVIVEEEPCDTGVMCQVHGGWTEWSPFGPCSAACGTGLTTSVRVCNNPAPMYGGSTCIGPDVMEQPCETGVPCPIDGAWGPWSSYSTCSVKCGKGIMVRSRGCNNPPPQFGGALCVGFETEEKMCDTMASCPVNGLWSSWLSWGPCSASCGTGFRQRHRLCDNPMPMFGGMECEGSPVDEDVCDTGVFCPIAGGWSPWSTPLPCPVECGMGITKSVRDCNNPPPMYGGPDCLGPSFQPVECDTGVVCPIHGGWSFWSVWGSCDKMCGVGMRDRTRVCNNPEPMFNGMPCKGFPVESEPCDTGIPCQIGGEWSLWGKWSQCSVPCGTGVIVRERVCETPMPQYDGLPCKGESIQEDICDTGIHCPIDGGWSPWSGLSGCSVTCGSGVMYRSRVCDSPMPQFNGLPCAGPETEEMPCDTFVHCPVHGNWGPWSDYSMCSVSCGSGFKKRERLCNAPAPMYGGSLCFGDAVEKVPCDTGLFCPIDGGWSMWSEFSQCAVQCGFGIITRVRTCTFPSPQFGGAPCKGIDTEDSICETGIPCPVDGNWSPWSDYSACSVHCGIGFQQRQRLCNNPPPINGGANCLGFPMEKLQCDTGIPCPIDGGWTVWGEFGHCSVTCGVGIQSKARFCTNPAPMYGGMDCVGPSIIEEPCDTHSMCPVHGMWSMWSSWGSCSVACGIGTTQRVRDCTNPAPMFGGMPCKGVSIETMECDTGLYCPVDGGWGPWGAFSSCSAKCGAGVRQQSRECNAPIPQYGGQLCFGDSTYTEPCDTGIPCPIDGGFSAWSLWSGCSVKCGEGIQTRSRLCDNPLPMFGGSECVGMFVEEQICHSNIHCPIHGEWGMWSAFSGCSVSCGAGTKERVRLCDSPTPMYKGLPCKGDSIDVQVCDTGIFCPVHGRWSMWTAWTACSVNCGVGLHHRTRSCTEPEPMYGGMFCTGEDMQEQVCNTGMHCPIHGNWGLWSHWTDCIGKCGTGGMTRVRECIDPPPQFGGLPCDGPMEETTPCETKIPCTADGAWGAWTAWTKCSAVCGIGETSRMRLCDSPAPMMGGTPCYGTDLEIQTCDSLIPCAVHGGWSFWSPWSPCLAKCGMGTKMRYRECVNPMPLHGGLICKGPNEEFSNCDTGMHCPVDGQWTLWTAWGVCETKCGAGVQHRHRECSNPVPAFGGLPCAGEPMEQTKCLSAIPCTVHGNWAMWSAWGKCIAPCGMGFQRRVRTCTDPMPMKGGDDCMGFAEEEIPCDSKIPCPIDGHWSPWSGWDKCDATCGKGFMYRMRTCTNPKPLFGGQMCVGFPEEKQPCDSGIHCPVHGGWSMWAKWDICDAKCGMGTQVRIRTCTNPRPMYDGQLCFGIPQEMRQCDTGVPCPVDGQWGHWTVWGACDAACGVGRRSRFRDCIIPDVGGRPCQGFGSEVSECSTGVPCVRKGGWTLWGKWSACSTACGTGMQIRERFCTNPSPVGPGMDCVGFAEDSRICDTKMACPIHGEWSFWSAFGPCITDCSFGPVHAEGFKFRERTCSNPIPGNGGIDCAGLSVEKVACQDYAACPEPVWSMWSKWGKCSAPCGPGDRRRERTCIDMNTKMPARDCKGISTEVVPCITKACPLTELNCSTECKWDNGIGYANYPGDCSLFVQCDNLFGVPKVHDCPWGLLYSLEILQCVYPEQSECSICTALNEKIAYHISCRAYWQCTNGVATPMCCPEGHMFDPFVKDCVPDTDGRCGKTCGPVDDYLLGVSTRCSFRESNLGSSWYEQDINGHWIPRPCGAGTMFSTKECGCVHFGEGYLGPKRPVPECLPELDLKFNTLREDLARNVGLHIEGVKYLGDGTAFFDGAAAINSNIFSNSEWGNDVYVYIRFKPDLTKVQKQGLVHNSGCGPSDIGPSVFIGFDRDGQGLTADDINMKFAAVPKTRNLQYDFVNITVPAQHMLDAWFKFGTGQFSAEVNGLKAELAINASHVARRHGALNIGGNLCRIGNESFEGFVGTLDEVRIYKCKPKHRPGSTLVKLPNTGNQPMTLNNAAILGP